MDREKFLASGLLEQYALGLTDEGESAEVERYLKAYPELAQQLVDMQNALHDYAEQMQIPCQKERPSLAKVHGKNQHKNGKNQTRNYFGLLLTWAMVSTSIGVLFYWQNLCLKHQNQTLHAQHQTLKERWEDDRHSNIAAVHQLDFIHREDTRQLWMAKRGCNHETAVIYWNARERRAILQMLDINKDTPPIHAAIWLENECGSNMLADFKLESPYIYDIPFFSKCKKLVLSRTLPNGSEIGRDSLTYSNKVY